MTYFDQDPFASNIVLPLGTVGPFGVTTVDLGPYECTGFQGARFFFENDSTQPIGITLAWFDDLSQVTQPFAFIGRRFLILNNVGAGYGYQASFIHPHLGDWLSINLHTLPMMGGGGNVGIVKTAIAHRQTSVVSFSLMGTPYLLDPFSVVQAGGGVFYPATAPGVFGGRVGVQVDATPLGGSGTSMRLYALQMDNTYDWIGSSYSDHSNTNAPRGQIEIIAPPAPLQFWFNNATGANTTMFGAIVPDLWRAR